MTDPFDKDEFLLDDEWVELCDMEGHHASFRHLATLSVNERIYMILGAMNEEDLPGALMLIREDETVDGSGQYVVVRDKEEIEQVIGRFVMRILTTQMHEESLDDAESTCGCKHRPGEFCFCDNPAYLQ